ncbi:unnamed protein product, partial [marine sediment metagenome]
RFKRAKKTLITLGWIDTWDNSKDENLVKRKDNGTIGKRFIRLKYIWSKKRVEKELNNEIAVLDTTGPDIHPVDATTGGSQDTNALSTNLEMLKEDNNNKSAAVSAVTEKNGKIQFTWPEVQNICNKVSNTKEFVINRIGMAISRIDKFPEPRTNVKGWIIKAIIDGYDLDTEPQETETGFEKEDRQILDRDRKENDFTLRDVLAFRKEALNNPEAQEFFSLSKTLNGRSNINQNRSRIEAGKQKILQAV